MRPFVTKRFFYYKKLGDLAMLEFLLYIYMYMKKYFMQIPEAIFFLKKIYCDISVGFKNFILFLINICTLKFLFL